MEKINAIENWDYEAHQVCYLFTYLATLASSVDDFSIADVVAQIPRALLALLI